MTVKQYEAQDMAGALKQVRLDLGEQAVILQTRRARRGISGWLGLREQVQVLAALDGEPLPAPSVTDARPPAAMQSRPKRCAVAERPAGYDALPQRPAVSRRDRMASRLHASGVESGLVDQILARCGGDPAEADVAAEVARRVHVAPEGATAGPQRIALVGPTGVGKTTTVAKLAARYALAGKKRVALITIDTYRIGAVEQLRTYARVMGLPLEVVQSPDEMSEAVARHADRDVVLIDTVGRSPHRALQLAEIRSFLNAAEPTETHLVLSVASSYDYLIQAADRFADLDPDRLIATKLDEMPRWGMLVSLVDGTALPLSYLTDGQEVPRNLRIASPAEIAQRVMGGAG